jgi:ATP-dependent DNA helicase PIF1
MSRATSRTNIQILVLPPDADAQEEEAKKMEKKNAKKNGDGKRKSVSNKKNNDKKTPIVNGTFTKNIVFKEVLTP